MPLIDHIAELSAKHRKLDQQIEEALAHPSISDAEINQLKREKLRVKDRMEQLQQPFARH